MIVYQTKVRKVLESLLVKPDPWISVWLYSETEKSPSDCFLDFLNRISGIERKKLIKERNLVMKIQSDNINHEVLSFIVTKNKSDWKVQAHPDEYKVVRHVGKGRYGSIDIVEDTSSKKTYIRKFAIGNVSGVESLIDESRILRHISETLNAGPNGAIDSKVVQFYRNDHDLVEQIPFILLGVIKEGDEVVKTKDLKSYLVSQKNVKVSDLITVSMDIITGLMNIHECDIAHRDLHHGNIVLYRLRGRLSAYIIDFGNSCDESLCDASGPKGFTPNELLEGEDIDLEITKTQDVYAVGINLFRLWHIGRFPLTHPNINANIASKVIEHYPELGGNARIIDNIVNKLLLDYSHLTESDLRTFIKDLTSL